MTVVVGTAIRQIAENAAARRDIVISDLDARMWEISENLHRAEVMTEQRYEQIAEYAKLAKEKREIEKEVSTHGAPKPKGGRQQVQRARRYVRRAGSKPNRRVAASRK